MHTIVKRVTELLSQETRRLPLSEYRDVLIELREHIEILEDAAKRDAAEAAKETK